MRKFISTLLFSILCVSSIAASSFVVPVVRVNGLSTIGGNPVVENQSYEVRLPFTILVTEKADVTMLMPNQAGLFASDGAEVVVNQMAVDHLGPNQEVTMTWLFVPSGDVAYCSPENASAGDRVQLTFGQFDIFSSGGTTYAIIGKVLTVTRGSVRVSGVTVSEGQSVVLFLPLSVKSASNDETVSRFVLEATVNACSARLVVPSAAAAQVETPTQSAFPLQPINPDIVSPSS